MGAVEFLSSITPIISELISHPLWAWQSTIGSCTSFALGVYMCFFSGVFCRSFVILRSSLSSKEGLKT